MAKSGAKYSKSNRIKEDKQFTREMLMAPAQNMKPALTATVECAKELLYVLPEMVLEVMNA